MAEIPTYAEWMKSTHSMVRPRSEYLKAVDEALKSYESARTPQQKDALKAAFDRWRFEQSKQGKDWKQSVRNQKGAVTNLHRALNDIDKRKLSQEELEAMRFIAREQALALQKQFQGKQLQFKSSTLVGIAQGTGTKWQQFKTAAQSAKSGKDTAKGIYDSAKQIKTGADLLRQGGRQAAMQSARAGMTDQTGVIKTQIRELCKTLCLDLDPDKVFRAIGLPHVEQFATDLAPFVGAISSGGKAVAGWIGVAKLQWDSSKIKDTRYAIAPGDPEAAFDALLELLDRERTFKIAKAGVQTGAFTGKLLGSFADAGAVTGPVIGLLETLAQILQTVIEYVRDYKECDAANAQLRLGALNMDLFKTSPVLGCYFLVVQDHSTIINFAVGDYGTPNWMFDVERLVAKVQKVLDKARDYIHASRLEIPGTEAAKGVVKQNYKVKTGLAKVTGLPEHVKGQIADKIDGFMEKRV